MRLALRALWVLCLAIGIVPPPAVALSPVPPLAVFCAPGSSVIVLFKNGDRALETAAENFWRRNTPGRVGISASVNLPEVSESGLALATACAYAVKKRLVELRVPSDRIDIDSINVTPSQILPPGYTYVEIK
jgi:hypothetical protein